MKAQNTILFVFLIIGQAAQANDGKFIEAMQKNIQMVYQGKDIAQLQTAVNAFERIGAAEKSKWEPHYYAAFGYIMMSNQEKDGLKKDAYLDQATVAIEKAKLLVPEESEITALQGFIYMMRVTVDPGTRGPQFAPLSVQLFKKALEQNPENPRAWGLLAQMQYGTAQFFGSSTAEACASMHASLEKFETFKSENPIAPAWGKQMAESLQPGCQ